MRIIATTALILFILLASGLIFVVGYDFGYDKCSRDAIGEFQAVYERGLKDGYLYAVQNQKNKGDSL